MNEQESAVAPDRQAVERSDASAPTVLDLELQALAYEAALRYGARQVPKPLVEFLRPPG